MADWPTRIDHGREVVDGSKIDELTLVVNFGGEVVRLSCCVENLDGQPLHALRSLAWDAAEELIESAHYEVTRA